MSDPQETPQETPQEKPKLITLDFWFQKDVKLVPGLPVMIPISAFPRKHLEDDYMRLSRLESLYQNANAALKKHITDQIDIPSDNRIYETYRILEFDGEMKEITISGKGVRNAICEYIKNKSDMMELFYAQFGKSYSMDESLNVIMDNDVEDVIDIFQMDRDGKFCIFLGV